MRNRTALQAAFRGAFLSLLVAGCGSPSPDRGERIEQLRSDAETLTRRQMLMGFESWAHGRPSNQDSLYRAFPGLFTLESIALVREEEGAERDSVQRRRLLWFRRYLTSELIALESAALADRAANFEAAATVDLGGERIPYRELAGRLANDPDAISRARVFAAADPVLDSLTVLLGEAMRKRWALAAGLDFDSYEALAEELRGFSLEETARMASSLLEQTDGLYDTLLTEALRRVPGLAGLPFRRSDAASLHRLSRFDASFPANGLLPAAQRFCRDLGINPDSLGNLSFDIEPREGKNPRAVCFPVDVPGDVRLSVKPTGGAGDFGSLLHELGHGLHFALTEERSFEFRALGDATVTEAYAFLCQNVLSNPAYLRTRTAMSPSALSSFLRAMILQRLGMARRYAAKVLFERALHAGHPAADSLYAALTARASGYAQSPSDRKRFLTDTDDLFYSAVYLRAWFLEARLAAHLEREFGSNWFENPAAGSFLRSLWRNGGKPTADDIARLAGGAASHEDLVRTLRGLLVYSGP